MARTSDQELLRLLDACNKVAKAFGQNALYQTSEPTPTSAKKAELDRSDAVERANTVSDEKESPFHVSIAWTLQQPDDELLARPNQIWASSTADIEIPVSYVKIKTGNLIHSIPLPGRTATLESVG